MNMLTLIWHQKEASADVDLEANLPRMFSRFSRYRSGKRNELFLFCDKNLYETCNLVVIKNSNKYKEMQAQQNYQQNIFLLRILFFE